MRHSTRTPCLGFREWRTCRQHRQRTAGARCGGERRQRAGNARCREKIRELRIFSDDAGKINRDVADAGGAILAVSQFTLAGSIERGRRPSFDRAEEPERARVMFELFVAEIGSTGIPVQTGRFREMMIVALENDGPVTFVYGC